MIKYITKNITTVKTGVIGHGVNAQGVMGSGIAKVIRNKWPIVYDNYINYAKGKKMLGLAHSITITPNELYVVNCYTQEFYGNDGKKYAKAEYVEYGFQAIVSIASIYNLDVYVPRIGCGLGGLSWEDEVKPIYERISQKNPSVNVFVCEWPG